MNKDKQIKFSTINLSNIKDSDGWMYVADELGLTEKQTYEVFEYGEYADLEIIVNENLDIIGGKILPKNKDWRN